MLNPNATEFNPLINHREKIPLNNDSITTTIDTKPKPKPKLKKKKKTVTEKQNTTSTTTDKETKPTTTTKEHKNKKDSKDDNNLKNKKAPSKHNNSNNNHMQTSKKKSISSSSTNSDNIQSSSQLQNNQQPNDKQQSSTNRRKKQQQQQTSRRKSSHHETHQTGQVINMEQPTNFISLQHTIDPTYPIIQHPTKKTIAHGYDRYIAWIERSLQTYETITLVGSDPALADLISLISIIQLKGIGSHHELATFTTDGSTSCIQVKLHRI
ncbi:hypothetical protein BJ944DRAFT_260192 [Cunninghamella echinulata]|nr:hypothetical protein BJ944DRAFT_260192 [Cunninghamella echinulata]